VQIGALGHVVQEGQQERRLAADGIEIVRSLLLGGLGRGQSWEKNDDEMAAQGIQSHGRSFKNQEWHCNSWIGAGANCDWKSLTTKGTKAHEGK